MVRRVRGTGRGAAVYEMPSMYHLSLKKIYALSVGLAGVR